MRVDGRKVDELRPVIITANFTEYAEGSVLIEMGKTKVLCNATIEETLPRWFRNEDKPGGWITGDYGMLPRSTHQRSPRETYKIKGRTHEIKRLIGRSLRAAVKLEEIGPRTCTIDCDVIQADGGTRTAAITGGYVALRMALNKLVQKGQIPADVFLSGVAAISVGIVDGIPMLDLCYEEDKMAEVDANIVMNSSGQFVEVQSTAEGSPFSLSSLDNILNLAQKGIDQLFSIQKEALEGI